MIYKECTMTIAKNVATLDEDIYLFRLDKNVELHFMIVNNRYKFDKSEANNIIAQANAAYFQIRLYKNADIKYTFAIQPTVGGKAILKITDDLIDDPIEIGDYDFQISLLDEDKTSMISMPIVSKQLHVCEPLVGDDATMGTAVLGLSPLASGEIKNAFDSDGNYIREIHKDGDILSAALINKFEEANEKNAQDIKRLDTKETPPYDDSAIKADINTIKADLGTAQLTTTAQDVKGAINEVVAQTGNIENNPIILDILARLAVLEIPEPLPEPTMEIIKKYSAYYIRTKWDDSYDMLEQIAPAKGSNGQFNFMSSSLIATDVADNSIDTATKITVKNSADDACPLCINNGYVAGNHGFDFNIKATITNHGKVAADIGSVWKDENNVNFTLITIKDANTLYFMSEDKSADGTWEFTETIGSTLTHVSGATNTNTITIEASANANLLPSINNYAYTMKTEKGDLALTSTFQTTDATYLEIIETFDIMDANAMLTYLRGNVGNNTNDSFHNNSIDGVVGVTNKYHFRPNGSCTIYTKYNIKKKIVLSKNPSLLGYIGFTQVQQMPKPADGRWNLYIPDLNPIDNVEYDTSIAQVNSFPKTYIRDCKNNKVASRATQYYTSSDGAICNKYGITVGYNTDLYLGRHEVRKNNVDRIFNNGPKMYIAGISTNSTNYDSYINAGEVLEMVSFRINENYSANPDFTSCNYYYVGDDIYYNIAIHKNFEGKIPVIGAMYGMKINIVEDNGNVTIADEIVKKRGIGITVTNNYGYVILKLSKNTN